VLYFGGQTKKKIRKRIARGKSFFSFLSFHKRTQQQKKTKMKLGFVPTMIIIGAALFISIAGGIIGSKKGDANCACRKKSDSGWLGFSVTWFLTSVAAIILIVIGVGSLAVNPKTGAAWLPASALGARMRITPPRM
jgi:hypothetical protein